MFNNNNNINNNNIFTESYAGNHKLYIKGININTKNNEAINVKPDGKITKGPENSNPITDDDKEKVRGILKDSRQEHKEMPNYKELEIEFIDKPIEDVNAKDAACDFLDLKISDNEKGYSHFGKISELLKTSIDYMEDYKHMKKIIKQYEQFPDKGAKFEKILKSINEQEEKLFKKMLIEEAGRLDADDDVYDIQHRPYGWEIFKAQVKGMDLIFVEEEVENEINRTRAKLERIRNLKERYKKNSEDEIKEFRKKGINIKSNARDNFYRTKALEEGYEKILEREKKHLEELENYEEDAADKYYDSLFDVLYTKEINNLGKEVYKKKQNISENEFKETFTKEYEKIKKEFEEIEDQYAQESCCGNCTIF